MDKNDVIKGGGVITPLPIEIPAVPTEEQVAYVSSLLDEIMEAHGRFDGELIRGLQMFLNGCKRRSGQLERVTIMESQREAQREIQRKKMLINKIPPLSKK